MSDQAENSSADIPTGPWYVEDQRNVPERHASYLCEVCRHINFEWLIHNDLDVAIEEFREKYPLPPAPGFEERMQVLEAAFEYFDLHDNYFKASSEWEAIPTNGPVEVRRHSKKRQGARKPTQSKQMDDFGSRDRAGYANELLDRLCLQYELINEGVLAWCHWCHKGFSDIGYHCSICEDDDFDVCQRCFLSGLSCLGKDHRLQRMQGDYYKQKCERKSNGEGSRDNCPGPISPKRLRAESEGKRYRNVINLKTPLATSRPKADTTGIDCDNKLVEIEEYKDETKSSSPNLWAGSHEKSTIPDLGSKASPRCAKWWVHISNRDSRKIHGHSTQSKSCCRLSDGNGRKSNHSTHSRFKPSKGGHQC